MVRAKICEGLKETQRLRAHRRRDLSPLAPISISKGRMWLGGCSGRCRALCELREGPGCFGRGLGSLVMGINSLPGLLLPPDLATLLFPGPCIPPTCPLSQVFPASTFPVAASSPRHSCLCEGHPRGALPWDPRRQGEGGQFTCQPRPLPPVDPVPVAVPVR